MNSCMFCRIVQGSLAARRAHETENALAFHDLSPQAPVHLLLIPKMHVDSLAKTTDADKPILGELLVLAQASAQLLGLSGYRLVINTGATAGQSVFHLHAHLLGGREFSWPPG